MSAKVEQHCKECGSIAVVADAYAQWNPGKQDWEVASTFDKGAACNDCDGETRLIELPYEPDDEDAREFHDMSAKVYYLEATDAERAKLRSEYRKSETEVVSKAELARLRALETGGVLALQQQVEAFRAAGSKVLAGLNARIEQADPTCVPVFDGIAELHTAVAQAGAS